jgi:MoxR-like ATPase
MQNKNEFSKLPAELLYESELNALKKYDASVKPPGWQLSPKMVRLFVVGGELRSDSSEPIAISKKFYGDDVLVDRAIVTLLGNRGLILVGEPGTAKSMLSELLTAAISGDSTLTIQGSAGTTEDHIKYSWNYAQLLSKGPCQESLIPSPIYKGMMEGKLVRFEELTRCPQEIQDSLVSILSDKILHISELDEENGTVLAKKGFNLIATSNLRDRGVHEMSSALKRRLNFETVYPLDDKEQEKQLVIKETRHLLENAKAQVNLSEEVIELLVTTFQDLRAGKTEEGATVEKPSTVMSTAEAVSVAFSAGLHATYFNEGKLEESHIVRQLVGTVLKGEKEDARKLRHYFDIVVKGRARRNSSWKSYYKAREQLKL